MKMILSFAALLTLALALTDPASAGAAAPPSQMPPLDGCWTLTQSVDVKLPNAIVWTSEIDFTAQDTKSVGSYRGFPGIWEAEILQGTFVSYVPMSLRGDSYLALFAGIADSDTHITGTYVDMRGLIDGVAQGYEVQVDPGRKIIFPIQSGWF